MIRCLGKILLLPAVVVGASVFASPARAGMIPTAVSVVTDGPNFRWTYGVVVTTDVNVKPGDSFTIYDFAGLVDGSIVTPDGWSVSQAMSGPSRAGTHPADDPGIANMTFTFNGAEDIVGQKGLGNFSAISTMGENDTSDFTSTVHRQVDGRAETNITTTDVPMPLQAPPVGNTPEPATLALMGLGLPVLGLARYLRKRKNRV